MWLHDNHPAVDRLDQLDRDMIEQFLAWNHSRPSRGRRANGQPISIARQHGTVSALKTFFEDITLWGWADRPTRPLLHRSDLPRLPTAIPRALSPDADRNLMAAIDELDDVAARCAIKILRGTGIRTGELLDLELDCLADYHGHGTWLRVPIGKLNTERTVPIDELTLTAFDEWTHHRGPSRPLPHPRTGRPVEFMWVINGRRMGTGRIRRGLEISATKAGIGHVHPHQLRHTYTTSLANGGMSIEALMAILGHVTPEMTLRYAHLAADTIRTAYDAAIAKTPASTRFVAGPSGQFVPDHIEWLHSEMIKTSVAHGYCSRHLAAGACTYANICEQCDNYVPDPDRRDVLAAQLADAIALHDDAEQRGWTSEAARHQHVANAITGHLRTIEIRRPSTPTS
jgi:integrase